MDLLVCSGTRVQLPAGQEVDVPVAFMSTLVGLLLTVEPMKASLPTTEPLMLTGAVSMHVPHRPAHMFTTYPKSPITCVATPTTETYIAKNGGFLRTQSSQRKSSQRT